MGAREQVAEILRDVEVGGALPIRFEVPEDAREYEATVLEITGAELVPVRTTMWVPDITEPETNTTISISNVVPFEVGQHGVLRSDVLDFARARVMWFYRHEALEQFHYRGDRPFVPVEDHPENAHANLLDDGFVP